MLLGAGYASWDITPKIYASLTGEADDAIKVDDFFAIKEITTFTSSPYGIYDQSDASSETIIREGIISVKFSFTYKYQQLLDLGYLSSTVTDDATTYSFSFLTRLKTEDGKEDLLSCISASSITATLKADSGSSSDSDAADTSVNAALSDRITTDSEATYLSYMVTVPIASSTSEEASTMEMKLIYKVTDYPSSDSSGSSTSRGYLYSQYGKAGLTFALEAQKAKAS